MIKKKIVRGTINNSLSPITEEQPIMLPSQSLPSPCEKQSDVFSGFIVNEKDVIISKMWLKTSQKALQNVSK